ncbi:MAG: hypothetical protein WDO74_38230 [Pseudomonadota bacterium]
MWKAKNGIASRVRRASQPVGISGVFKNTYESAKPPMMICAKSL